VIKIRPEANFANFYIKKNLLCWFQDIFETLPYNQGTNTKIGAIYRIHGTISLSTVDIYTIIINKVVTKINKLILHRNLNHIFTKPHTNDYRNKKN
jgi:hypothetical protein